MASANSTTTAKIWFHQSSKKWCITKQKKRYYLGSTESEAQARYEKYQALIQRGLPIPKLGNDPTTENGEVVLTVRYGCNAFLTRCKRRVAMKNLSSRSFQDYVRTCERFRDHVCGDTLVIDLRPEHFMSYLQEFSKVRNIIGCGNEVTRVKTVFKWLHDEGLLVNPVRFGPDFCRPKKRDVRLHYHRRGRQIFIREECMLLLDELGIHYRAMAFLGLNCGFKNADCEELRLQELFIPGRNEESQLLEDGLADIRSGESYIASIRTKTGEHRLATLWPETVEAVVLSLARRPKPNEGYEDRVFLHYDGNALNHGTNDNLIGTRVRGALQRLKLHEAGMNFSWLRPTFRTVADKVGDDVAARWVMGHADDRIDKRYIFNAPVDRIRNVTDHVRDWLLKTEFEDSNQTSKRDP